MIQKHIRGYWSRKKINSLKYTLHRFQMILWAAVSGSILSIFPIKFFRKAGKQEKL